MPPAKPRSQTHENADAERAGDNIAIAVALVAGIAGIALATASSSAGDDSGTGTGGLQLAASGDPAFVLDGVTAVSISVGGSLRPAALAHNAFTFSDDALGGSDGIAGKPSQP